MPRKQKKRKETAKPKSNGSAGITLSPEWIQRFHEGMREVYDQKERREDEETAEWRKDRERMGQEW